MVACCVTVCLVCDLYEKSLKRDVKLRLKWFYCSKCRVWNLFVLRSWNI